MRARGLDRPDVLLVTADPLVDHPSFPAGLLARVLEAEGFCVALASRPDPADPEALRGYGIPRLFAGVTAGALDSMVANYTALRRRRSDDAYAPGGGAGGRPDRALTVYCNLVRKAFGKQVLVVAGGLECSLRRFSHYDFWSDSVRRPILMDCGADLGVHGQGENVVVRLARAIRALAAQGKGASDPRAPASLPPWVLDVAGLIWRQPASQPIPGDALLLPSHEEVAADPTVQARAHALAERSRHRRLAQRCGGMAVIVNRPDDPSPADLDRTFFLPFTRNAYPVYGALPIPALEQVRFSVTSHRGCFGGCAFCAITAHQGRRVCSRSQASILAEVERIVAHPDFRGTIPDLGGPTANMYGASCASGRDCERISCLWPSRCRHLVSGQRSYADLLEQAAAVPGVRHLFVTTGIRMDLALEDERFMQQLASVHTSGHLKVAPEHVVPHVLRIMRKPSGGDFASFVARHRDLSGKAGRRQYVLPYLMAAHPGCRLEDMVELALFLRKHRLVVEQCQIFTPTPGTAATVMYATGLDPATMEPVFVERNPERKRLQKALILSHLAENAGDVRKALRLCGREDLLPVLVRS